MPMLTRLAGTLMAAALVAGAVSLTGCATMTSENIAEAPLQEETERAVARVAPSLVRIAVVEPSFFSGREVKGVGSGSGAIITPEGHIITNHHVAGKAVRLVVTMPNREEVPARLIGTDPATDIAVIQLEPEEPTTYPYVTFGDSDQMEAGDAVLALGSPRGISQSVTRGILSNAAMVMPSLYRGLTFELDGENVGELVRWFAHDAEIHPGNSGGPLVNMDGEIIGVNEISFGLGGAIPGNLAQKVAMQLIEEGKVRRAWMGVSLQPLLKSSELTEGVLISSILEDSPAQDAGLQPGDVITQIGDTGIEARFYEDLPIVNNIMADLAIGEPVDLVVLRGAESMTVSVTPVERQAATTQVHELRQWGITGRDLSVFTQLSMARETSTGLLVTSTRPGGPAAKAKPDIKSGDIITDVAGQEVSGLEEFERITAEITEGAEDPIPTIVAYERRGENFVTVVEVGVEELVDPARDVQKAWLPIETQVLTRDLAEQLDMAGTPGVRITRIYEDLEGSEMFEVGDLITHIDGEVIPATEPHDSEVFRTMIRQYDMDIRPVLTVLRDGEELTLEPDLIPSPQRAREMKRWRDLDFEFVAREAAFEDRTDPKLEGVEVDVLADSVTEGGWAALGDLRVGDVILAIDGAEIDALQDVEDAMDRIHENRPARVVFKVRRGIQNAFLEMEPFWPEDET